MAWHAVLCNGCAVPKHIHRAMAVSRLIIQGRAAMFAHQTRVTHAYLWVADRVRLASEYRLSVDYFAPGGLLPVSLSLCLSLQHKSLVGKCLAAMAITKHG